MVSHHIGSVAPWNPCIKEGDRGCFSEHMNRDKMQSHLMHSCSGLPAAEA